MREDVTAKLAECYCYLENWVQYQTSFSLVVYIPEYYNTIMAEPQPKYGLEIGIMAVAIVVAVLGLYIYVRFSPAEKNIPPEYFFKVREPKIRQKREAEAKAKKAREETEVNL